MNAINPEQSRARVEAFTQKHRIALLTMLFTDVVGSTRLKQLLGDRAAIELIQRHHALIRELVARFPEAEEIASAGDSFFIVFAKPSDAAHCALLMQNGMRRLREETGHPVLDRIGVHVGEVFIEQRGETARDLFGIQIDTTARVMSLGDADQILLSRFAFDSARQILRGFEIPEIGALTWLNHGYYEMKGVEEPVEVCEVGETDIAALTPPDDSEKAHRFHSPTDEPVLGWRPAPGQLVPGTRWLLERSLGEGGFGEVWLAHHEQLKQERVIKFCFNAERARSLKREVTLFRVLRERVGEHPNIVAIHDVFFSEPPFYIIMDYVEGPTFDHWVGAHAGADDTMLEKKLEVIAQVADALQAAHDSGIIHRDVKPSNVLVTEYQGVARAKLTDFGIGEIVNTESLAGITRLGFTQTMFSSSSGTGTHIYMAPELLSGQPATTRSDIYSLGVILWQTLTGDFTRPITSDWAETVTDPLLREDIRQCVTGDPQKRFAGAAQLATRLRTLRERHTIHEEEKLRLVAAERRAYRRGLIRAGLAASVILGIIAALAFYGFRKAREARRQEKLAVTAKGNADEMLKTASRSDMLIALDLFAKNRARDGFAYLARAIHYEPSSTLPCEIALYRMDVDAQALPRHVLEGHSSQVATAKFSSDGKRVVTVAQRDSSALVWDSGSGRLLVTLEPRKGFSVWSAEFSPDGQRIVTASNDQTARVWDSGSGKLLATLERDEGFLLSAKFSPEGRRIVTASSDHNTARVLDTGSGKPLLTLEGHQGPLTSAEFSPDGQRIVTASKDNTARVWDSGSGKLLVTLEHKDLLSAKFSPDGLRVVTGSGGSTAKVWDSGSGKLLATLEGHNAILRMAEFSPDGQRIVTPSSDGAARVWDSGSGELLRTLKGHTGPLASARFSPDGQRIVTASWDNAATVWSSGSGKVLAILEGHASALTSAEFSPDGQRIVTASVDKTARVWDSGSGLLTPLNGKHTNPELSPDGERILTRSSDNTVRVWDMESGKLLASLEGHKAPLKSAEFSPDGERIVTASEDNTVRVWNSGNGKLLVTLEGQTDLLSAKFNIDGQRILTASKNNPAQTWDSGSGKLLATLKESEGYFSSLSSAEFSPDGLRVVTGSRSTAKVWDSGSGKLLVTLEPRKGYSVRSAEFSPDGQRIVTASDDETVRVWDSGSGKLLATHEGYLLSAKFSPDGKRIVTASRSSDHNPPRVLDSGSGKLLATLEGPGILGTAEFSPDGQRIVSTSAIQTQVWESESGKLLATLPGQEARFSPDGSHIVTTYDNGARVWNASGFKSPPPTWYISLLHCLAQRRLNERGLLEDISPADWLALRNQVEHAASSDTTRYGQLAQWFLLPPEQRPVRPGAKMTQHQAADSLLHSGAIRVEVVHAYELWPAHPLVHIALAALVRVPEMKDKSEPQRHAAEQTAVTRADFLRRYDLQRLPPDPAICRRAAEMLRGQGQEELAREAETKAVR